MEQNLLITTKGKEMFVKLHEVSKDSPNIIFIITPIVSVDEKMSSAFMDGLTNHNCNIFAMDFLGIGKSEGNALDITYENMKESTIKLITYIKDNYNDNIHFYGGTGTGGIIGQALCSDEDISAYLSSFIQYGVGIYGDISIMGNTSIIKIFYPLIKLLKLAIPEKKIKFKIPKYEGYNSTKENQWYKDTMFEYPGAFDMSYSLLNTLLKLFLDKKSKLRNELKCPVLVLASLHDRYYYKSYLEKHFESIKSEKKIIWYDDSHLSFYWNAKTINNDVIDWVLSITK